jgi:acetolactate synthase I/II/III large subunit
MTNFARLWRAGCLDDRPVDGAPFPFRRGLAVTGTVVDAIAQVLHEEGVRFLSAYPTTPMIDAAARAGIKPVLCRQERVGVGIADGYSRVADDGGFGVFACQYGPGAENAFPGIASAYSDGIPLLVLPLGNALGRRQLAPLLDSESAFKHITKSFETIVRAQDVGAVMRRAISAVRNGPPGPVMVEIPLDVATQAAHPATTYRPVGTARPGPERQTVEAALDVLLAASSPIIIAGNGVLRSRASTELVKLSELLCIPVMSSLAGKSAMPETHPLSLGMVTRVASDVVVEFLRAADVVFAVGTSLTDHFLSPELPPGCTVIHATIADRDLNKSRNADYAILGDSKLVLREFCEAAMRRDMGDRRNQDEIASRIAGGKARWLKSWESKLTSNDVPITPYRAIHDFMQIADPDRTIVTHDSGSPRDQIAPFYVAGGPNTYLGWGKSHALGAGLGLSLGAKIAAPDKLVAYFHGDAAVGMTGLDIETAVRCSIPILAVVLNNATMAIETKSLVASHELYRTRDIGGDYAALARTLGVESLRVDQPAELADAYRWGLQVTQQGRPALIEIITSAETDFSNRGEVSY